MGVRGGFAGVVGCGVGFLVLLLVAAVLVGCRDLDGGGGVTPPPPPPSPDPGVGLDPSDPRPLFVPAGVSASEYGASLPFDISAYDSNAPGVFTVDEMSLVDVLSDLHADGVDVSVLQGMVDRFHTVGPVIPHAVRRSYEEYVKERVFDSELVFDASTIGIVDLHQMLPVWSFPSRYADPNVVEADDDPVLSEPPTKFPVNYAVNRGSGPDWLNEDRSRFLAGLKKFAGIEECNVGENILNVSSLNMNLYRRLDPDSPTFLEILWIEVSLPTLPGAHVTVDEIFVETRRPDSYEHNSANIRFQEHFHPYDRTLVDSPYLEHVLGHVVPGRVRHFSREDFAFSVGDAVTPDDVRVFVNPHMGAFLLDYVLLGPAEFGVGYGNEFFAVDDAIGPRRGSGKRVVDVTMARFYPEGIQARPIQPRYSQNLMVYAPCSRFSGEPATR